MSDTYQGLSRSERLRSKLLWKEVMERGSTFFHYPVKLWVDDNQEAPGLQVAFVAPKRRFRRAVDRNREKRYLREAYRLSEHRPTRDLKLQIVFLSVASASTELKDYRKAIDALLLQLKKSPHDHQAD
jgi:ribonuclease P protein component